MRILTLLAALLALASCADKQGIGFTCGAGAAYCDEGTAT
jgi:hypothetical protein